MVEEYGEHVCTQDHVTTEDDARAVHNAPPLLHADDGGPSAVARDLEATNSRLVGAIRHLHGSALNGVGSLLASRHRPVPVDDFVPDSVMDFGQEVHLRGR